MTEQYDVIVVGVGGMGSAACAHLASRGVDVLGIERFDVPHAKGSSHGSTRIIRKAYHEHPDYVPLVERAYENWRELEAETGRDLLHVTGSVCAAPADGDLVANARQACEEHDLPYDSMTGAELNQRFPGYGVPDDYDALYQPDGGFLDCEQSVIAHVERAQSEGGTVHAREQVTDWSAGEDGVRVETDRGEYAADSLVLAAGAWAGDLLPELDGTAVPERQVLGWFQPPEPADFTPETFPVFVTESDDGAEYYGFPRYDRPGMKVGVYRHLHEDVDPDDVAAPTRRDEQALRAVLTEHFPAADGPTMGLSTCMFTNTPDMDFVVDTLPDRPDVVVAAGFSGHGFKFSSAIGEALADLALHGETDLPVDGFAIDRPAL
ncbi:N-methyl-L-tryptophan oxidase [Haloarchaeobius amylolyticus]|uniref:N-methyl-L-tryptophan oxidase n=1 Tax=Haloarchaeobius amylolyticus TaxID=1198296 RepID=UPI00226E70E1|nr:N-methyl-L-tryptophan oxidase [Haloarchaeobius amylolyticus]